MYNQYFGLSEAPFSIAVNPRYLFMSVRHRDALAHLLYGVGAGGGFILLTGEVGTGKTTINRCLLEQLPDNTDIAIVLNPALNAMELLATVCDELGISYDTHSHTLKTLTDSLHTFLLANYHRGRKTVLLIDEAQHLDFDVLEQIRLLTNLETHSEKLLQIILIGQPELAQMLAQPELRQLNQRITARYNLKPLNLVETGAYIRHRLQVAGMSAGREVFPPAVVRGIYRRTRGIPRLINVLCDRMLLGAYGRNKTRADKSMLRLAVQEVMGGDGGRGSRWAWPAAIAAVLLLALAGLWRLDGFNLWPVPASVTPQAVAAVEARSRPQPVAQLPTAVVAEAVQPAEVEAPAVVTGTNPGWLLAPAQAMSRLWELSTTAPAPLHPCGSGAPTAVLACVDATARTWDELAGFDRPLLLNLITDQRFGAGAVMVGIDGLRAWLVAGEGDLVQVDLATLGPLWSGGYHFLWQPPEGFERALGLGDNQPVVAKVAALFARLDGQQQPLSGTQFNKALQQRVRLFQREYTLDDDGKVGMQTLLKLNEVLGVDTTAERARQQLRAATSVVTVE